MSPHSTNADLPGRKFVLFGANQGSKLAYTLIVPDDVPHMFASSGSAEEVEKAVGELWSEVESVIADWDADVEAASSQLEEVLKVRGTALGRVALDEKGVKTLSNLVPAAAVLSILGSAIEHIPWEAIFLPEPGPSVFLSDLSLVARMVEPRFQKPALSSPRSVVCSHRITVVQRELAETLRRNGAVTDQEACSFTNLTEAFSEIRKCQLVTVVCNHDEAKQSLMLSDKAGFTLSHVPVHRFPEEGVLCLFACRMGERTDFAKAIAAETACTVLGFPVLLPGSVAAKCAAKIEAFVRGSLPCHLDALHRELKDGIQPFGRLLSVHGCWNVVFR